MPATTPGVVKIPTPMTFEMTMMAASKGPSRRSSEGGENDWGTVTRGAPVSSHDQRSRDRVLAQAGPLRRAVLGEQLDLRVDECLVLQHLLARLGAGVSQMRPHREDVGGFGGAETAG